VDGVDGTLAVAWSRPTNDGGCPVSGYQVARSAVSLDLQSTVQYYLSRAYITFAHHNP